MIENINTNQAKNMLGQNPIVNPDPAKTRSQDASDVALRVDFAELVEQAKQASETNADAVEEARQLLNSGRLTTPENVRSAARDMLDFGV